MVWVPKGGKCGTAAQDNGIDRLRVNGEYVHDEQHIVNGIKQFWEEIGGMNEECIELNGDVSLSKHETENMEEKMNVYEVKKAMRHLKNGKAAEYRMKCIKMVENVCMND